MSRAIFVVVALSVFVAGAVQAQDPLADCEPADPQRLTEAEVRTCLMLALDPAVSEIDQDLDGMLSEDEIDEFLEPHVFDLEGVVTLERLKKMFPAQAEPGNFGGLLIRDTHEQIGFLTGPTGRDDAWGATFSYSRDEEADEDTWVAQGAILRPIRLDDPEARPEKLNHFLVPALSFDRSGSSDAEAEEADSLIARLFYELEGSSERLDLSTFRFGVAYATDFDLKSDVGAIEAGWEPTILDWGIGAYKQMSAFPGRRRIRVFLSGIYGETYDVGNKVSLVDDDPFARLGGRFEIGFRPKKNDRCTFRASYRYMEGLDGMPDELALFIAAIEATDSSGRFGIEAEYRNGKLPVTADDVEYWTLGLTVKN